jgi:terminase large subunit-like protein
VAKKQDGLQEAIRRSPVEFVNKILTEVDGTPAVPHPAQAEILEALADETKNEAVILTGRQFGKSHMLAWYIIWFMLRYPFREVWLIAPSLDQARIIFNEIAGHFRKFPLKALVKGRVVEHPFPRIVLENGSEINVRGANSPQFIRGHHGSLVVIDEAAFIKEGIQANVIEPLLTVGGSKVGSKLVRISTPFGKGEFYDAAISAMENTNGKRIYKHFTTLDNPHIDLERVLAVRDLYGENSLIWQTEYLANLFVSDNSVFDWDDIRWAYENFPEPDKEGASNVTIQPVRGDRYAQGVDLANMEDYFVSVVLNATNQSRLVQCKLERHRRRGYPFYKQLVRSNHYDYNNAKTLIDGTTLGASFVQDLSDIHAEPFVFSGSEAKYDLIHHLVSLFTQHKIVIPFDRDCINELRFFQYKITAAKRLKIEAKRGYHDDYVAALALASKKATEQNITGFFRGVSFTNDGPKKIEPDPRLGRDVIFDD